MLAAGLATIEVLERAIVAQCSIVFQSQKTRQIRRCSGGMVAGSLPLLAEYGLSSNCVPGMQCKR